MGPDQNHPDQEKWEGSHNVVVAWNPSRLPPSSLSTLLVTAHCLSRSSFVAVRFPLSHLAACCVFTNALAFYGCLIAFDQLTSMTCWRGWWTTCCLSKVRSLSTLLRRAMAGMMLLLSPTLSHRSASWWLPCKRDSWHWKPSTIVWMYCSVSVLPNCTVLIADTNTNNRYYCTTIEFLTKLQVE